MSDPLLRAVALGAPAARAGHGGASPCARRASGCAAARPAPARPRCARGTAVSAPWLLGLVVANWLLGLGSVRLDPRDLELAASGHFQVGSALVVLYGVAALISRRIDHDPRARAVHPWIGAAALLLSGVQVFLGLQLMPL